MSERKTCFTKLKKEMTLFIRDPPPYIPAVSINENNILEWYFLIQGPPNTPYEGGWYIGKLKFPPEYPFKPPSIFMLTQNGRFKTDVRLCLSMSDYHPESWNPLWSVSSVLTGLLSFMLEDTKTAGSIETTDEEKRAIAAESANKILSNLKFNSLFPQIPDLIQKQREGEKKEENDLRKKNTNGDFTDESVSTEGRLENLKRNTTSDVKAYEKALAAINSSNFCGAIRECQMALARGAPSLEGHQLAATCCLRLGSFEDVHAHLAEAHIINEKCNPSDARQDWWQWAGSALRGVLLTSELQQKEVKDVSSAPCEIAEACCIAERDVNNAESLLVGDGINGGDPESALHLLDVVIVKHCSHAPAILMLKARALTILGDFEASMRQMELVIEILSSCKPKGLVDLGPSCVNGNVFNPNTHLKSNLNQKAISHKVKGRWDPGNITTEEVLDELGNVRAASRHRSKGNELFRKCSYESALQSYARALAVEEKCASVHANRAAAFAALGRFEESILACNRALQLHKNYGKVRRRRAECLAALGNHNDAIKEFGKALELAPQDPELLAMLDEQKQLVH